MSSNVPAPMYANSSLDTVEGPTTLSGLYAIALIIVALAIFSVCKFIVELAISRARDVYARAALRTVAPAARRRSTRQIRSPHLRSRGTPI